MAASRPSRTWSRSSSQSRRSIGYGTQEVPAYAASLRRSLRRCSLVRWKVSPSVSRASRYGARTTSGARPMPSAVSMCPTERSTGYPRVSSVVATSSWKMDSTVSGPSSSHRHRSVALPGTGPTRSSSPSTSSAVARPRWSTSMSRARCRSGSERHELRSVAGTVSVGMPCTSEMSSAVIHRARWMRTSRYRSARYGWASATCCRSGGCVRRPWSHAADSRLAAASPAVHTVTTVIRCCTESGTCGWSRTPSRGARHASRPVRRWNRDLVTSCAAASAASATPCRSRVAWSKAGQVSGRRVGASSSSIPGAWHRSGGSTLRTSPTLWRTGPVPLASPAARPRFRGGGVAWALRQGPATGRGRGLSRWSHLRFRGPGVAFAPRWSPATRRGRRRRCSGVVV
jgi:hypothetical protein